MKRIISFNEAVRPVHHKIEHGLELTRGDMVLFLIDKILNPNWGRARLTHLPFEPGRVEGQIKKILVIQTSSIGDLVYTTPALRGLKERYPDSRISILVSEVTRELILGNPNVDNIYSFPNYRCLKDLQDGDKDFYRIVSYIYKPIKQLQMERFDLVINLSVTPMSAIITHLIAGRNVWGLTIDGSGRPRLSGCVWSLYAFYIKANWPMQDLNRLDLMELHLRMAGVNPSKRELSIFIEPEIRERCYQILADYGVRDGDLVIGLNPGAGFKSRCWPPERFAKLADFLIKEYKAKIIIFGGPKEGDLAEEIVRMMQTEPINLATKTSLKEMAAYLTRCDHLITNDTGPMHIAAAMKTPVIGICGPTLVGPLGKEGHLLLRADLDCVGCGTTSLCTKGDCMRAIPVEAVLAALRYQRGELKAPPEIEGVNIYGAGRDEPTRLFFYQALNRRDGDKEVGNEIIKLLYLNLWIRENNRLGFSLEEEISAFEMQYELMKRFSREEMIKGIEKEIEILKEYSLMYDEAVRHLRNSRYDEESLLKYKVVSEHLYNGIGRIFSLYDYLYPDSLEDHLAHLLKVCQIKSEACRYMVNFLEEWRKVL